LLVRAAVACAVLASFVDPASLAAKPPAGWRTVITRHDDNRLRHWRDAWTEALAKARAAGAGPRIDAEGVLLQPDAALGGPAAPDGLYRCRVIKIGAKMPGGLDYVAYPGFRCRIAHGMLTKLDGSQRPVGRLYPMDNIRMLFLGAMALGDEAGEIRYGDDTERDMLGLFERVGPNRWRLALPYPEWESLLDVMELVPADK